MIRVITAIILGFAAVAGIWWLPAWAFDLIVLIAVAGSLFEFSRMFLSDFYERWMTMAVATLIAAVMIFFMRDDSALISLLVLAVFILCCLFMWRTSEMPGVVNRIGVAVMSILYLGVALSMWSWLRHVDLGREWVMFAIVPSCLCDTFAYLVGKMIGRHRMAPLVSPNKTMEGFFGALLGSLIGAFIVWFVLLRFIPWWHILILAICLWFISPFGDLIESMMKRSAGVKDSGTIIPGHGGLLDRLDALTFAGPFVYAYVRYVLSV